MTLANTICDPWPVDWECADIPDDTTDAVKAKWALVASDFLRAMTGNRIGPSCPVTVRPCYGPCNGVGDGYGWWFTGPIPLGYSGAFYPYMGLDGQFRNWRGCGCRQDVCQCGSELCRLPLPGPIYDVVSIHMDGVALPVADVAVQDGAYLVRTGAALPAGITETCWPTCQDLSRPAVSDPNTFFVEYRTGLPVPPMGVQAVSELAAHFIRGCSGGCGCGVGSRNNVRSISRQGVDLEFVSAQEVFEDGRTGILLVDLFIRAVNPSGLPRAMRVLSPDMPRRPIVQG